ncbi:hypothetical protein B0O99DRAFT_640712, partial [Bisporella sp. PMI_857]
RLASIEEDLGLRYSAQNAGNEEGFYSSAAIQQVDTGGKDSLIRPKCSEIYKDMLFEYDSIPFKFKLFATCSLWLLLFGFVLFSGTFTTFKPNPAEEALISKVENMPMFVFGILFCGASSCALLYLSRRWKKNWIWLVERILLPGFINSATGLGNALISVGTVHHWEVSATAKSTIIITTSYLGIFTVPLLWYSLSLWRMKKELA